ncbi:MAG: hypothetical protein A3I75_06545 [Deltaproteobacteria bacterium RIFCSPLOWO2_02_FULL_50_16]|nr:MAG: hypothetical protein A3I75_06545 [Deltaproteobacteria bacterium RIFCSPLOWO2_02_FULL_50_16]
MSRPLRIEYEGAWYHVINRGAGRRKIFIDQKEYDLFFELLNEILETWNVQTHAFSLIPNHYHLAIHTPNAQLSRALRHLNGVYTQRFNRRHKTDGPLFRGRFKSKIIEKETYLLELVRYIHLNPVKAALTKRPQDHRWTSHLAYINDKHNVSWLFTDEVLSYFGKRRSSARNKFDHFVNERLDESNDFIDKQGPILGSKGFIEWVRYNFVRSDKSSDEIPEVRRLQRKEVDFSGILGCVSSFYGIEREDVLGSGQGKENEARKVAVYLMKKLTGADYGIIANYTGGVKKSALAQLNHRFKKEMRHNDSLSAKCDDLAQNIMSNVRT